MKTWKMVGIIVVVSLTVSVLGYLSVGVAEEGKSIEHLITEAKTSADHEAVATAYDKLAQEAHQKHADHKKMEEWYKKNPATNKAGFSFHCDRIGADYDKIAKEYEGLAKLHKDMAKHAK
jgi:hypothetical protein